MNSKKNIIVLSIILTLIFSFLGLVKLKAEKYNGMVWKSENISGVYINKIRANGRMTPITAHFMRRSTDNDYLYCLQPFVDIDNKNQYTVTSSDYETVLNLTKEQWERVNLISYYGYKYPGHSSNIWYAVAQLMIWRTVEPSGTFGFAESLGGTINDNLYIDYINEIEGLITNHYKFPQFSNNNIVIPLGQTLTLTDTNNVLSNYNIKNSNKVNATINGNTLNITATEIGDASISLSKEDTFYSHSPLVYFVDGSQDVLYTGSYDPINIPLNIKVLGGKVRVRKVDFDTNLNIPQGDATFEGATYGIYKEDGTKVGVVTLDKNGNGESDYLPSLERFYLLEESNPNGYELDTTKYYFTVSEDNLTPEVTVKDKVIKREVNLYKVFANGGTGILVGEPNIEFEFYLISSGELYKTEITDSKGKLEVILPYGKYRVHQKNSTLNHEKVDDFEIDINDKTENPYYQILSNAPITARLKLVKIDKESTKPIIREGLKFKIKDLSTGEYIKQTITYPTAQTIDIFEMDKNGIIITPYPLKCGKYAIEEVKEQNIYGYVWNSEPLIFEIGENSSFIEDDELGVLIEIKFANEQVKGELIVNKFGEKVILENDSFKYEEIKLDDVYFELYANGDIYSQDGTLVYKDETLVKSFYTKDGSYKVEDLYLGKYCLIERASVSNHVVDSSKNCFELSYKNQFTKKVTYTLDIKNYLKKGVFEFTKTDVAGNPLPNTTITILTNNEGEEQKVIFKGKTDSNGKIIIKDLFVGKFIMYESEAPEGYILNSEPMEFEIKENGEIVKSTMINEKEIDIPNTEKNEIKETIISGIILIIVGMGIIIYGKLKKKKR